MPPIGAARGRTALKAALVTAVLGISTAAGLWAADRLLPPPLDRLADVSTEVLDRDGRALRIFLNNAGAFRLPATVSEVEPLYLRLLLEREDRRFYRHGGVDPLAVARAAWQNLTAGRVVSGASTLTMQVARLLDPKPRTLSAKLIEACRALQLERRYDKDAILGMYLTLAPFGGNLEGVRTGARAWLGKEPRELTAAGQLSSSRCRRRRRGCGPTAGRKRPGMRAIGCCSRAGTRTCWMPPPSPKPWPRMFRPSASLAAAGAPPGRAAQAATADGIAAPHHG